jgi:signal transduction histidine kinase
MKIRPLDIAWRVVAAMLMFLAIFAGPVYYVLFAENLLDPGAVLAHIWQPGFALRFLAVLVVLCALSMLIALNVNRQRRNPFLELAESIRRIAMRDFNVRIGPSKSMEPREMFALTEAFNEMAAALQRSEEQRNNLMADVSHELRTPLTVLEGNLRAALDRVYPLDEAEIANLYGQTRHLIRLVDDLHELALADARRLPLSVQSCDLAQLVGETLQIFAPLAEERGVTLRAELEALPPASVDAARIRQVLHNLLTNALRHTPSGGAIVVSGAVDQQAGAECPQVVLAITDTGDGLEPDQLAAVFDRFYRTDRSRSRDTGGTGLGLAIASAIVASHGGTISAASDGPGQGSSFTIRLPVSAVSS